eukprot:TRINITY_DN3460_c0_g1_i1.p1 TRINITY_DN3460_c0_g1~~TRINITY_DN3460_c0_g1_i1.p1  ORF type:complete len:422 (-),score=87.95 TRINITY_DN3460_c0_g1_i1:582-1847(-)
MKRTRCSQSCSGSLAPSPQPPPSGSAGCAVCCAVLCCSLVLPSRVSRCVQSQLWSHSYYGCCSVLVVWGVLVIKLWGRHSMVLSHLWGCHHSQAVPENRPAFQGVVEHDEVTGEAVLVPNNPFRHLKLPVAAVVTLCCVAVVLSTMAVFTWAQASLGKQNVGSEAVGVINGLVIVMLTLGLGQLAERITEWQNHRLEAEHKESVRWKRFVFEGIAAYWALIVTAVLKPHSESLGIHEYIGGCPPDPAGCMVELQKLCLTTLGTRITLGTLAVVMAPRASYRYAKWQRRSDPASPMEAQALRVSPETRELELVLDLGYLILFGGVCPVAMAALCASTLTLSRWAEAHSITFECRRSSPRFEVEHSFQGMMLVLLGVGVAVNAHIVFYTIPPIINGACPALMHRMRHPTECTMQHDRPRSIVC